MFNISAHWGNISKIFNGISLYTHGNELEGAAGNT